MDEEYMRRSIISFPTLQELAFSRNEKLSGQIGSNRAQKKQLQIRANNDYEAIYCWLREYQAKATTFRTYQKEAERFLLWCLYQQKKPLSSINREDMDAYILFLNNPIPEEIWCAQAGGRGKKRGSPDWRPFVGPLQQRAQMTALSALDSLFNYLVSARYLEFNPMALIRKRLAKSHQFAHQALQVQQRILQLDEWHALLDTLASFPETTLQEKKEKYRLRLIIAMLFFLGLRVHELSQCTWNAFQQIEGKWWCYIVGKGDKPAKIPVNDALLKEIIHYRMLFKMPPLPAHIDTQPVIQSFRTNDAITERQINKLLKELALLTAKKFVHSPDKQAKIKKFSAHWLRHLSASLQDKAGVTFKHIRANLRHENDDTTRLYVHAFDEERHQDSQKLTWRIGE